MHVNGALNRGVSPDEIFEAVFHAGVYGGLPAANSGAAVVRSVLAQRGLQPPAE